MKKQEYIITYPNMDYQSHVFEFLFTSLGCNYIRPPKFTDKTREMGRKLGREGFCQPLNNCIGDLYFAIKDGANSVISTAGVDQCRYGFYWANQKIILEDHFGFEIPFFIINHLEPEESVINILDKIGSKYTLKHFTRVWHHTMEKINSITDLNRITNKIRAREKTRGETSRLYNKIILDLIGAKTLDETKSIRGDGEEQLRKIEQKSVKLPLRVLLVGEIYEVLEPHANYNIEEYFATLGVEVERSLTYQDLAPILSPSGESEYIMNERMLTHYACRFMVQGMAIDGFGGYGKMTISHAARAKDDGFDGIIHLYSFSCMPDIIAKPFIKKISELDEIPSMSIVVEEIGSRELFYSRLEAFVDLLRAKKTKMSGELLNAERLC